MFTVLSRIIHYGYTNFWRNGLLSTATVAILTLSLIVFIGLIFANVMAHSMIAFIQDKIDISVYFKTTSPEDQILRIRQALIALPEVKSVDYISSDQALADFRAKHQDDPTIIQSINELKTNPFEATLNIKANDPDKYGTIASYLDNPDLSQYVDTVTYSKNQQVIEKLIALIASINRVGLTITILLSAIAGLVVFNTIRLVIYSNRDEIGIMRAVGASNALVRGPYIVEGVITGAIAAVISLVLVFGLFVAIPSLSRAPSYFDVTVPGFNMAAYFYAHILALFGYQLLFGVGVSVVSSFIAVRRYLRS